MPEELKCGTCTACCTVLEVVELEKEAGVPCCHLAEGCSIYQSRPAECRDWSCGWLRGLLGEDERLRPDRLGLMFTLDKRFDPPALVAIEVWEGASKEPFAAEILDLISAGVPVIVREGESEHRILSPTIAMLKRIEELSEGELDFSEIWESIAELNSRDLGPGQQQISSDTIRRDEERVGRNDPCPCGSGKKFKKCCRSRT